MKWSRNAWISWLPEHADYLNSLPNRINRADVTAQFVGADRSEDAAVRAFIAAMVWGYGRIGYGPYRTAAILASTDQAGVTLLKTLQETRRGGGPAGFTYLAKNRLKGLGVAFGTKYLYFCVADSQTVAPAPILDSVVRNWLAVHDKWRPRSDWNLENYGQYCTRVREWADELQVSQGTVEFLMFAGGTGTMGWSARGSKGGAEEPLSGVAAVLAALTEAAAAFDALPDPVSSGDAEAFRQGIEALEQIAQSRA
jgi:hypothetical protein